MEDLPEAFIEGLVELLSRYILYNSGCVQYILTPPVRPLQQLFQEEAKQLLSEQNEGDGGIQRKRHNVLTQQIQELWNRARLFVKGIDKFEGMGMRLVKEWDQWMNGGMRLVEDWGRGGMRLVEEWGNETSGGLGTSGGMGE